MWNGTNKNGDFPGVKMTDTNYRNGQGQAVYKVEVDSTSTGLVFSNGKKKKESYIFIFLLCIKARTPFFPLL